MDKKDNEIPGEHELGAPAGGESGGGGGSAPRARNRTVMLTPEITGQVRARLAQDLGQPGGPPARGGESAGSTADLGGGFFSPPARGRPPVSEPTSTPPLIEQRARVLERADQQGVTWQKKTPVVGFLVSYDSNPNGDIYELRSGRLIITSEAAGQGNYLLVKDESVSPMHAILRIGVHGEVQVLDQLSEFGTRIKKFGTEEEIELSGDKGAVGHGDLLIFGRKVFHVCMVAQPPSAA